jgi:hypothetical protein
MSQHVSGMRLGTLSLAGAAMVACSTGLPSGKMPGASPPAIAANAGKPVTFNVSVDPQAFSDKTPITVSIWDETQRQIMDETSGCSVSYNAQTQQETTSCPPGITYRKATPETFQLTKANLAKPLVLTSKTVTVGERYRLAVSGKASDDCNSASASTEAVAASPAVTLANLPVAQTMMACISGPMPMSSAVPTATP